MRNPFLDHPASVGESYFEHLFAAAAFGARMVAGGIACMIHAVLPFAFVRTGGDTIRSLNEEIADRRHAMDGHAPLGRMRGLDR